MKNQKTTNRRNYKYTPVSTVDDDDDDIRLPTSGIMRDSRAKKIGNEISTYAHSLFWIGLALFVIKYSDLIRVIRLDDRVILPLLYIAGASWMVVISLVVYLSFFLPCCKKERIEDFNVTHPQHIYATLFLTVVSYVTFVISIWPIWGWMSILIGASILMGLIMIPNFIPNY
eukprot:173095_1